jgi:hypothetical protein
MVFYRNALQTRRKVVMIKLTVECADCGGTGLYCGFMEHKGEAVVFVRCGGKGYQIISAREFTGRKHKNGVEKIRGGSGTILDDSRNAKWITYDEFRKRIPDDGIRS